MIDPAIMLTLLKVMSEQKALACDAEENYLWDLMNLRANRVVSFSMHIEHLKHAKDQGWLTSKLDSLRQTRWRITPAGENALSDLPRGG